MRNIKVKNDGNRLILTIDLAAPMTPSRSGKTSIIATTAGNKVISSHPTTGADVVMGLNVYAKATA